MTIHISPRPRFANPCSRAYQTWGWRERERIFCLIESGSIKIPWASWHVSTGRDLKPRDHLSRSPSSIQQDKLGQPGIMGWQKDIDINAWFYTWNPKLPIMWAQSRHYGLTAEPVKNGILAKSQSNMGQACGVTANCTILNMVTPLNFLPWSVTWRVIAVICEEAEEIGGI